MIFRAVVFTFIPTAIELVLVSWLLARSFSPSVAALVIATFVAYVAWTTLMTKVSLWHGHRTPATLWVLSCTRIVQPVSASELRCFNLQLQCCSAAELMSVPQNCRTLENSTQLHKWVVCLHRLRRRSARR